MNAKEKIKLYLKEKGINPSQFYKATGLSNGFLDQGKGIGSDNVKIIIDVYSDINLYWLIMDVGEMLETQQEQKSNIIPEGVVFELLSSKDKKIIKMAEEIGVLKYENKILKKQIGYTSLPIAAEPELKTTTKHR